MCLFDYRCKFRNCEILIGRDLDHVHVLKLVLPDCLPRTVRSVNEQELLLENRLGKSGIEVLNVVRLA